MLQLKDPTKIKLFGKTIPCATTATRRGSDSSSDRESLAEKDFGTQVDNGLKKLGKDELLVNPINEKPKTPSSNEEAENANGGSSNITEETNSNEKVPLKKPDKILPCPRCHSMDTKFCYYNNYNVHQPRHFCKGCQRYWTAGGAMRNVPVGAGRRKSKSSASQNRLITISDVLQAPGVGSPNGVVNGHPAVNCSSVLTVGSDATVSASTGSVTNLREMPFLDPARNPTQKDNEQGVTKSHKVGELNSCGSSVTVPNEPESKHSAHTSFAPGFNSCLTQIPCIPAWPYPWNAAIPPAAFPHPGFALPFIPPNYWNCAVPNTWNPPWFQPQPVSQNTKDPNANPRSNPSMLRKHSREGEMVQNDSVVQQKSSPKQVSVLTPKTLRIDHPEEAAKSSIWETLGIKNETTSKGGLFFKDLKSKDPNKINHVPEKLDHLTANPAALCRALNFHEVS